MRGRPLILVAAGFVALVAACGGGETTDTTVTTTAAATTTTEGSLATTTETNLAYATWRERTLTLDVHVPEESVGAPIVIFVPGSGGSGAGDPPFEMVEGVVEKGAILFVLHQWAGCQDGAGLFLYNHGADMRGAAESVACAIHFARARASQLGSDDPVVVLTGFSAGGGPATHAALLGADLEARWEAYGADGGPPRQVECEITEGSTDVDALVGIAGTYDIFVPIYEERYGRSYYQEHDPELGSLLSSAAGVNLDLTVRLIHGTTDNTIPYENSVEFKEALTDAGYDVQLATWDGMHTVPAELTTTTITEVMGS